MTDVGSLRPGQSFRVGIRYQMAPGWHIYWKYSGDAGLPTKVDWQLPPGFVVGDLHWPLPVRDREPGELEVFAYPGEVLLYSDAKAPAQLPPGPVRLAAHSEWLVCERSCVPGSADLGADLPVGEGSPGPNAPLFAAAVAATPGALPTDLKPIFSRQGRALTVTVEGLGAGEPVDFYPVPPAETELGHGATSGRTISFEVLGEGSRLDAVPGVLVVGAGAGRRAYDVTAAAAGAATTAGDGAETGSVTPVQAPPANPWAGLLQALAFGFLGGIILNAMPCVLPVISLKVFGFVSEAGEERDKVIKLALAFVAGILSCFLALAVAVCLLRGAGAQVGWGFQFQDYRFVFVTALLVFIFALNLFGVFEFTVSARGTAGLAKLAAGQGYGSAFFQGVFATVLATPCTAPFLGTASAFAFTQGPPLLTLVFLAIGLGLASPYLLLAANPRLIRWLPKPGSWMVHLKQFFGFLLLGTLLWVVWVAGQLRGVDGVVTLLAALLVLALLAWIKGRFWTPVSTVRTRLWAAAAMLLTLLTSGWAYQTVTTPSRLSWNAFSPQALADARASGRPVFVDFTADWCITCKANERFAIDTPPVRNAFSRRNVVTLRADWTHGDEAITKLLREHGRAGVPMYLYFPAGTAQPPIVLPELISSQTVLDALARG